MGPETGSPEIACQSQEGGVITSGGGFSIYTERPSWQATVIDNYFNNLTSDHKPTSGYDTNGRGYPDISLIAVNYQVYIGGSINTLFGTSASSPVLAAFVSLVNAYRLENNQSSIGFLNPTLYSVGWNNTQGLKNIYNASYNDVTSGHNKCCAYSYSDYRNAVCCDSGFYTAVGWDPVTGWGSINFPQFAAIFDVAVTYTNPTDSSSDDSVSVVVVVFVVIAIIVIASFIGVCCYRAFCYRPLSPQLTQPITTTEPVVAFAHPVLVLNPVRRTG
jgi:hypothetical protein